MEKYIIKGGNKLSGEINISGAKNATLGILAASILSDEDVIIENIPNLKDVNIMIEAIKALGAKVEKINKNTIKINAKDINTTTLYSEDLKNIRATYYFAGALLGRFKKAKVVLQGGCNIGKRPIDLHIKGFRALGSKAEIVDGFIDLDADNLLGTNIYLDVVSVGATINIMLASVFCEGTTIIENVAKEPHVVDIANFMNSMGANIKGAGTDIIRIKGVKKLHSTNYTIISDQIEAGTYLTLVAATGGDVIIKNVIPKHLESIMAKLVDMGNEIIVYDEAVRIISDNRQIATSVKTMPYPGFPTDLQPQIVCALSCANGSSKIIESIFEDRFNYIKELKKMGATITINGASLTIDGVDCLKGADMEATDLRAGAALTIAALMCDDYSTISKIDYIERGYEDFEIKLKNIGAKIERVNSEEEIKIFKRNN